MPNKVSAGAGGDANVLVVRHGPFYRDPRVVKQCLALCDAGYDVTVLCRGSSTPWVSRESLHIREARGQVSENPLRLALQSLAFAFRVVVAVMTGRRPDVVIVHSIPSWLVFGAVMVRLRNRRVRILLDHHEPEAEMLAEAGLPSPAVRVYRWIERAALRTCDGVVDVSPEMARRSAALGAREQVVVDNAPLIFEQSAPRSKTWDLAVFGSLIPRYDLAVVDRALGLLDHPIDVVQLGNGEAALSRNESGGRLDSLPYSPPPELQARLRASRFGFVGLAPSQFTEFISPNRLWELVSLEVPAIVADTRLMRGLIQDHAVYYEGGNAKSLADAMRRAHALSSEDALAMARGAKALLRDRLWDRQSAQFVEFCRGRSHARTHAAEPSR